MAMTSRFCTFAISCAWPSKNLASKCHAGSWYALTQRSVPTPPVSSTILDLWYLIKHIFSPYRVASWIGRCSANTLELSPWMPFSPFTFTLDFRSYWTERSSRALLTFRTTWSNITFFALYSYSTSFFYRSRRSSTIFISLDSSSSRRTNIASNSFRTMWTYLSSSTRHVSSIAFNRCSMRGNAFSLHLVESAHILICKYKSRRAFGCYPVCWIP